ncbi:MAG: ribosome biogenesis GTPase Der [Actinomycetes bacterium]
MSEFVGDVAETAGGPVPVLAVVGRPNVGKSTLVNRILGRREAVVQDVPGITRDRVPYDATWNGRRFTVVDTGGWEQDAKGLQAQVAAQAELAIAAADAVLFVVDATVGATDTDEAVVRVLRRAGKPVVLVANKVDDQRSEAEAAMLWSLGLGEPYPVSALHGRGSGDLLDAVLGALPETPAETDDIEGGPRRVALLGRPNVGKSSLLNQLAGEHRVVVDPVAGTTRDPVDELVELGGTTWRFVDTAGIRRRAHQSSGTDYYATLRTQSALDRAEVAVVLVDASDVLSEQDTRIISMVVEAGRALVIAYNKWDLLDDERRFYLEREIERDLVQVTWAPRVNMSARTGRHMEKLVPALDLALGSWDSRVSTGRLNAFLGELVASHPHPIRGGKQPRILFGTQADTRPPRFVLFATGFLEAGYRRFVERRLRENFGFAGTPIEVSVKMREKHGR